MVSAEVTGASVSAGVTGAEVVGSEVIGASVGAGVMGAEVVGSEVTGASVGHTTEQQVPSHCAAATFLTHAFE